MPVGENSIINQSTKFGRSDYSGIMIPALSFSHCDQPDAAEGLDALDSSRFKCLCITSNKTVTDNASALFK